MTSSSATDAVFDADEALAVVDPLLDDVEHPRVEDHVAVHPEHAALLGEAERLEQALAGVGGVVDLVVDEGDVGHRLDHDVELEPDDGGDVHVGAVRRRAAVHRPAHDALAVAERGQRLGVRPAEPGAEPRGENDDLGLHELLLGCPVVEPVKTSRDPTSHDRGLVAPVRPPARPAPYQPGSMARPTNTPHTRTGAPVRGRRRRALRRLGCRGQDHRREPRTRPDGSSPRHRSIEHRVPEQLPRSA